VVEVIEHLDRPRLQASSASSSGTRTGRPFFDDDKLEAELLARVRDAAGRSELFERLESDWLVLDCELMPWSAKAQELLRQQYAAVGAAARLGLGASVVALEAASARIDGEIVALLDSTRARSRMPAASSTPTAATAGPCARSRT
jgi:protein phosphatase